MKALRAIGFAIGVPVVLVLVWWLATRTSENPFAPKPDQIVIDLVRSWTGPVLTEQVLPSLMRLGIALGGAILLGIGVGLVIGTSVVARKLTGPVFEFVRAVPPPVLLPVLLLIMGIDDSSKVFLIFLGCLWPILLNTIDGARSADPVLQATTASYGLRGWVRFRHFLLPSALPRIMTGIRLALPISLILMVVSEMYAATDGLGYQVMLFKQTFHNGPMWSGILIIGLIGVAMATLYGLVERRVLGWYRGQRETEKS